MKTSQQIIGLPVVSISDGNEIGKVKNLMINAVKGTVDFFVIDSAMRSLAGGVVPIGKVLGIGADALTILEADDVSDIVKIPAAIDLLQKNITVRGTRVLTRKGSLLGVAGDVHVDEDAACGIVGVEFVPGNPKMVSGIIPRDSIITFGKNLLVVEEGFTARLLTAPTEPVAVEPAAEGEGPALFVESASVSMPVAEAAPVLSLLAEETVPAEPAISLDGLFSTPAADDEASAMIAHRRTQHLHGRRITRTLVGTDGEVIAQAGDRIDETLVERAGKAGCLVELVMNNEP